jgi:hypothetical protein
VPETAPAQPPAPAPAHHIADRPSKHAAWVAQTRRDLDARGPLPHHALPLRQPYQSAASLAAAAVASYARAFAPTTGGTGDARSTSSATHYAARAPTVSPIPPVHDDL